MCYDAYSQTLSKNKYAKRYGASEDDVDELERQLQVFEEKHLFKPNFHTNGFQHLDLLVIANDDPKKFQYQQWGLIPFWVKDEDSAGKIQNQTINARGETIFEKPSFREPAKKRRCIIFLDGFFEHHHYKGKTYPYLIKFKNNDPMLMGGIWDAWINKETGEEVKTVSIVTTSANPIMARIHNNPKLKEPRMPLILSDESKDTWLFGEKEDVQSIVKPYPEDELEYFTVRRLRGKEAIGNVPEALEEFKYPELDVTGGQTSLF